MNGTAISSDMYSTEIDHIIGVILLIMALFGLCGNGFVLWVLAKKLRERANYLTTLVLLQLAVTDLVGVLPTSFIGYCLMVGRDLAPETTATMFLRNVIGWLGNVMPLASIYLVTILSFGRCIAVYRSFDYPVLMSTRNTMIMCLISWGVAVTVANIPYYGGNHYEYDPHVCFMFVSLKVTFPGASRQTLNSVYILINLVLVVIPALFMIACCAAVIVKLRRKISRNGSTSTEEKKDEAVTHAANTVFLITIAFIACYGPYFLYTVDNLLERVRITEQKWLMISVGQKAYLYITIAVHFVCMALNSCINPLIYYLRAKKFRQDMGVALRKKVSVFTTSFTRMSSIHMIGNHANGFALTPLGTPSPGPGERRTTQYRILQNGGAPAQVPVDARLSREVSRQLVKQLSKQSGISNVTDERV